MQNNTQIVFIPAFKKFIAASVTGRRLMPSGKKFRTGTIQQYGCVLALLEEYEQYQNICLRIQLLFKSSLRMLQKENKYWVRFFKTFSLFLYKKKKYFDQYTGSVFKVIKTFFHFLAVEKSWPVGDFYKFFRIPAENIYPVILSPNQLRFLITNKEFEDSLSGSLKKIKDIFVFGSTVALRYQDLMRISPKNIQHTPDAVYLTLHTRKTGAEIRVPLPGYAIEIIRRYKKKPGRFILPQISCTNINLGIKKLIRQAGWDYHMPKIRHRRGEPYEIKNNKGETYRFYDHITAHTMRRTAITTLLLLGVDENSVRRISGHAAGSKEFYKYVVVIQDYLNTKIKEAHKKLIQLNDK